MLNIQPSQSEELQQLYKLERLCHRYPWTLGILQDCLRVGYLCHSLTIPCPKSPKDCTQTILIGFMISQVIVDECHLLNICIHPDYQGNGYGLLSLNWLEQLMREKDVASLLLEVRQSNLKAQGLYKKLGFEQIGLRKDYYPADSAREAAIVMRKLL